MPALEQRSRDARLVGVAVGGLANQAEIAVACGVDLARGQRLDSAQCLAKGAPARGVLPGLDDVTDEVDAARHRLQDRLRGIQRGMQSLGQKGGDPAMGIVEPLRRFVQQDEVIDIAHVPARAQLVPREFVEAVQKHIGKELAGQVADR